MCSDLGLCDVCKTLGCMSTGNHMRRLIGNKDPNCDGFVVVGLPSVRGYHAG